MNKFLILKTGTSLQSIVEKEGDFEQFFIRGMNLKKDQYQIFDVTKNSKFPDKTKYSGILITGSPANITEKHEWIDRTSSWIIEKNHNTPILGVCFGHQLLAHAFGGEVDFHPKGMEIGHTSIKMQISGVHDELFSFLPHDFDSYVVHSQTVTKLPENAVVLASNQFDKHQGVRYAHKIWGTQFHPEYTEDTITEYILAYWDKIIKQNQDPDRILKNVSKQNFGKEFLLKFKDICLNNH